MAEFKLSYTASEINKKLGKVDSLVASVNGVLPDANGNVEIQASTVTAIDFTNFKNGSFTETVDGETVNHTVTFDTEGRPVTIDGVSITWGDA